MPEYRTGRLGTCNSRLVEFAQLAENTFHLQSDVTINPVGSREDWILVLRRMTQRRACRRSQVSMIYQPFFVGAMRNGIYVFRNPLFQSTRVDGFRLFESDVPAFEQVIRSVLG